MNLKQNIPQIKFEYAKIWGQIASLFRGTYLWIKKNVNQIVMCLALSENVANKVYMCCDRMNISEDFMDTKGILGSTKTLLSIGKTNPKTYREALTGLNKLETLLGQL